MNLKIFGIYAMWTLSSSVHSNDLKLMKTPKPIKLDLFKNPRVFQFLCLGQHPVFTRLHPRSETS